MTTGLKQMIDAAHAVVPRISPAQAQDLVASGQAVVIDVRDAPEVEKSGKVAGRQTYLRTDAANGVTEIGHIYWGPLVSQTPATTEALYLFARHVFDDLGYRRFEWKCNNDNEPSKRAALRYGFQFEGIFRKHMIIKGKNRDTAWYAMTDDDWKVAKPAFEAWLSPSNFDENGKQTRTLSSFRTSA